MGNPKGRVLNIAITLTPRGGTKLCSTLGS